jgi:hypothetical protein
VDSVACRTHSSVGGDAFVGLRTFSAHRDIVVAMAADRGLLDVETPLPDGGVEINRKSMSVGDLDLVLKLQDELQRRLSAGTLLVCFSVMTRLC